MAFCCSARLTIPAETVKQIDEFIKDPKNLADNLQGFTVKAKVATREYVVEFHNGFATDAHRHKLSQAMEHLFTPFNSPKGVTSAQLVEFVNDKIRANNQKNLQSLDPLPNGPLHGYRVESEKTVRFPDLTPSSSPEPLATPQLEFSRTVRLDDPTQSLPRPILVKPVKLSSEKEKLNDLTKKPPEQRM